jgi:GntR family transcriptional regulator
MGDDFMKKRSITKFITDRLSSGPVPKHYRIRESLRQQIRNMESGEPIPTEVELCDTYGVSRTTVRKAIERLTYEGLVYRVQGKGTFVAPPKVRGRFVQSRAGLYDDARARGLSLKTQVLEQQVISADKRLASRLEIEADEPVFKLVRLRFIDQEPMLISYSYVPETLCPGLLHEDFESQSLYALMQQKYGIEIHHGLRVIEAISCEEEEAQLFHVTAGTPLLVVTGTMYDGQGIIAEYGFAMFRGDRSQVEIQVVPEMD